MPVEELVTKGATEMSFDQLFQQLAAQAAQGQGNTFVFMPVTVNLGSQPSALDPTMLGRVIEIGLPGGAAKPAWDDAERQAEKERYASETKGDVPSDEKPETDEATDKLKQAMAETNFRGTVDEQTLIDKAVKLGLPERAGTALWGLCNDDNMDFPRLGKNGKFRRSDLRELAKLEGITRIPGFGSRSQALKVLRAL